MKALMGPPCLTLGGVLDLTAHTPRGPAPQNTLWIGLRVHASGVSALAHVMPRESMLTIPIAEQEEGMHDKRTYGKAPWF